MRNRAIAAVIAVSCAAATAPIAVTGAAASPVVAHAAFCVHARVGGKKKCLAVNQLCLHRYEATYQKYGFTCVKRGHPRRYRLAYAQQQQQG